MELERDVLVSPRAFFTCTQYAAMVLLTPGGGYGCGVLDGLACTCDHRCGRGSVIQRAGRALSRESRLGGRPEAAASGDRGDRAAETTEVSPARVGRPG